MIGLHPTSVKEDYMKQLEVLEDLWTGHKFIAVGEIGIDLYWDKTFIKEQIYTLRRQITFALEKAVPVVIHSRDSFPELFSVLDEFEGSGLKGVLHAFTGDTLTAERAVRLGFMLGIGGIVTFKNAGLDKVVNRMDLRILFLKLIHPILHQCRTEEKEMRVPIFAL